MEYKCKAIVLYYCGCGNSGTISDPIPTCAGFSKNKFVNKFLSIKSLCFYAKPFSGDYLCDNKDVQKETIKKLKIAE